MGLTREQIAVPYRVQEATRLDRWSADAAAAAAETTDVDCRRNVSRQEEAVLGEGLNPFGSRRRRRWMRWRSSGGGGKTGMTVSRSEAINLCALVVQPLSCRTRETRLTSTDFRRLQKYKCIVDRDETSETRIRVFHGTVYIGCGRETGENNNTYYTKKKKKRIANKKFDWYPSGKSQVSLLRNVSAAGAGLRKTYYPLLDDDDAHAQKCGENNPIRFR